MITINIVCVGNLKEKFWVQASEEYSKRLSRFCNLKITEIEERNKLPLSQTLEKEGQDILKAIKGTCFLLEIDGKQFSSQEFAAKLDSLSLSSSEITFVIGSSNGVSEVVKETIKNHISFGKATYPHNLARIILLEQIYRAFMINSGSTYHK